MMRLTLLSLLLVLPCFAQGEGSALPRTAKIPLDVLFLGTPDSDRSRDFMEFLRETFRSATFVALEAPLRIEGSFDVALVDARETDGPNGDTALGEREQWTTPMVLLGSAGLHLSAAWKLRGGWG